MITHTKIYGTTQNPLDAKATARLILALDYLIACDTDPDAEPTQEPIYADVFVMQEGEVAIHHYSSIHAQPNPWDDFLLVGPSGKLEQCDEISWLFDGVDRQA